MCNILKVNKSGYYRWLKGGPSNRWKQNERLLVEVKSVFDKTRKSYGSPRITEELKSKGWIISVNRVAKLMQKAGVQARRRKKYVVTTNSKHNYPVAPNLLNRDFSVSGPGQVWVSDITYIKTVRGWLYLTVIIDLFDRKVIGWSMSKGLTTVETIIPAWMMAIRRRPITQKLIFHSDRGIQYACNDFTKILNANNMIKRSMSRKGNCWDNAVAESFFKSIKVEWIYKQNFIDQQQAEISIFDWIETWYNRKRRHSALGYKTINEFNELNTNFTNAA